MISPDKLKLLECYHKHICESIKEVSNVVEEGIKNLNILKTIAFDYLKLIEKETNNE